MVKKQSGMKVISRRHQSRMLPSVADKRITPPMVGVFLFSFNLPATFGPSFFPVFSRIFRRVSQAIYGAPKARAVMNAVTAANAARKPTDLKTASAAH